MSQLLCPCQLKLLIILLNEAQHIDRKSYCQDRVTEISIGNGLMLLNLVFQVNEQIP